MFKVEIDMGNTDRKVLLTDRGVLLRVLSEQGIMLTSPCGGKGQCGKCKVKVSGCVSDVSEQEKSLLMAQELNEGVRLACLCEVTGDAKVKIEQSSPEIILDGRGNFVCNPDNRIIGINKGRSQLGVAIDLGTTTLAAYLLDLGTGKLLSKSAMLNPQIAFGADVLTRAQYTIDHESGLKELSGHIRKGITSLIKQCCRNSNTNVDDVYHIVVAGNTIMLHLLCEEQVETIAVSPFTPVFLSERELSASDMGIAANQSCIISLIGGISGYVGADIVAGLYNSGMEDQEGINLFLDIGTNGEIVAGGKDRLISCATAAGPAFEGGHIRFGMASVEGAISSVVWQDDSLKYEVIGGTDASGLCGSGLLDAVAVLLDNGIIDGTGLIAVSHSLSSHFENALAVEIAEGVFITQGDIRNVQLAKSAIATGIEVLLAELKAEHTDVRRVYLSGGFGSNLNPVSACKIGIFDPLWQDRIVTLGNSSGHGALEALSDYQVFEEIKALRKRVEYIELSCCQGFNDLFMMNLMFEPDNNK
jgi:uncharacterized 2Fe-2S/4Fe-4S cluster protein (DUF4445 family)